MGLTEEELMDRAGTDSDGEGIDLRAKPPKEDLDLLSKKMPKRPDMTPAALAALKKNVKEGLRVGTKSVGPASGDKIFFAKIPFSMFKE